MILGRQLLSNHKTSVKESTCYSLDWKDTSYLVNGDLSSKGPLVLGFRFNVYSKDPPPPSPFLFPLSTTPNPSDPKLGRGDTPNPVSEGLVKT